MQLRIALPSFQGLMRAIVKASTKILFACSVSLWAAGPLAIAISTDKTVYSSADQMHVSVTITNTSGIAVSVPNIDDATLATYVSLSIVSASGTPAFTIDLPPDSPVGQQRSTTTLQLLPSQSVTFQFVLNVGGAGIFEFTDPSVPSSIVESVGGVTVTATFMVNADNRPTGGDPGVFLGTVSSGQPAALSIVPKESGDLNATGTVDCSDVLIISASFGKVCSQAGFDPRADVNNDCIIDINDLATLSRKLAIGLTCRH